jgi:hypothetical protein
VHDTAARTNNTSFSNPLCVLFTSAAREPAARQSRAARLLYTSDSGVRAAPRVADRFTNALPSVSHSEQPPCLANVAMPGLISPQPAHATCDGAGRCCFNLLRACGRGAAGAAARSATSASASREAADLGAAAAAQQRRVRSPALSVQDSAALLPLPPPLLLLLLPACRHCCCLEVWRKGLPDPVARALRRAPGCWQPAAAAAAAAPAGCCSSCCCCVTRPALRAGGRATRRTPRVQADRVLLRDRRNRPQRRSRKPDAAAAEQPRSRSRSRSSRRISSRSCSELLCWRSH